MTKLAKDFGVRALLATIGGVGFYGVLVFILFKYELDLITIVAIIGMAQAPWTVVLGFYFATRAASRGGTP